MQGREHVAGRHHVLHQLSVVRRQSAHLGLGLRERGGRLVRLLLQLGDLVGRAAGSARRPNGIQRAIDPVDLSLQVVPFLQRRADFGSRAFSTSDALACAI